MSSGVQNNFYSQQDIRRMLHVDYIKVIPSSIVNLRDIFQALPRLVVSHYFVSKISIRMKIPLKYSRKGSIAPLSVHP